MSATTLQQTESAPAAYPDAPTGLSTPAAALDPDMIWQRIENYIAHRFTEREVEWIVEGCGEWHPPLAPTAITTIEIWNGAAWAVETPAPSPTGYCLDSGTYRFVGTVGDDDAEVPAAVQEAFRRLAEYLAADKGAPGATSERIEIPGVSTTEVSRSASWAARAMQNSGAGDLLRNYRRAA